MDPLSITTSAVALIQAAGFTATTIYNFVKSIRTVDARISGLCEELSNLQDYLESVHKTLDECRSLQVVPAQPDLWQRCDEALKDCLLTLNSLKVLIDKIRDTPPAKGKGLRWRAKVAVDLSAHGNDLAAFREKIHKSNIALQTMLHTITVSLSLKSNASQEQILFELEQLKYSFKEALRVSSRPSGVHFRGRKEHPDARVSRNLHNLAAAARQFHSAASSTSGTARAESRAQWHSIPPLSLLGDFPEHKRQRVEEFVGAGSYPFPDTVSARPQPSMRAPSPSPSQHTARRSPSKAATIRDDEVVASEPTREVSDIDDDEELEDEMEYFEGLRDLARDRIRGQDFAKAIEFINQAMTKLGILDDTDEVVLQLQVQLALCHFFKGDWRSAEPIVWRLTTLALNEVTCNLLHALSLAHLSEYSLDSALRFGRKALKGKREILERKQDVIDEIMEADYGNTLGLCSTIYHMKGDPIFAEVFHRRLPKGFGYQHPSSELEFIFGHPSLLPNVLGDDIPKFDLRRPEVDPESFFAFGWETVPQGAQKLYRSGTVANSPLRQRFARHEIYESDTDKIVAVGPSSCSPSSPADSGIDMTVDNELRPATASGNRGVLDQSVDSTRYHEMPSESLNPDDETLVVGLPSMTSSGIVHAPGTSVDETLTGETIVNGFAASETPSESSRTSRENSPVTLPLRRRLTRMFTARRPSPTATDGDMVPPLTCPPEPSAASSGWFHNPSRLKIPRSKTLRSNASVHAETPGQNKTKTKVGQRILRLGPMELTIKRTRTFRVLEVTSNHMNVDLSPGPRGEACSHKDDLMDGIPADRPANGSSKGRLTGLTMGYYGPDASVGPYTYEEKRWPFLDCQPPMTGNATVPHGPGDIVAAVELDTEPSSTEPGPCDVPTNSSKDQVLTAWCEAQIAAVESAQGVKGQELPRLDTSVKSIEQRQDAAQCRAQLPGRLAGVLAALSMVTDTEKQSLGLELEELRQHVHTCLHDSTLEADLQRILDGLGIRKRILEASHGKVCVRSVVLDAEEPPRLADASSGLRAASCNASVEEPAPTEANPNDPDSAVEVSNDKALNPESLAPKHYFAKGDDANLKFVMPDKWGGHNNHGNGHAASALMSREQDSSPSGENEGLRSEEGPARVDLHRAFSFVVGDEARYICRRGDGGGDGGGGIATGGEGPDQSEETQDIYGASPVDSPVRKKQVSWAAEEDLVRPAGPSNEEALGPCESDKEEEIGEKNAMEAEAAAAQHRSSSRRFHFIVRDVSWWRRKKHEKTATDL